MGLFSKKDPAAEYQENKRAYLEKTALQSKTENVYLQFYKAVQDGQLARLYVKVTEGNLKVGDLLDVEYTLGNRLGINSAVGKVNSIYQILAPGGFGKQEQLAEASDAYPNDEIWIAVSGIDVSLMYKTGTIRKSKAKNVAAEDTGRESVSVSYDEEVSQMVNYFKNELYGYFVARNNIGHITQDLGYSLMVQKNRLDKAGIAMAIEKSNDIDASSVSMKVKRYSSSQYDVAEADEAVKLKRTYHKFGRIIYQDDNWRICHYLLAGAKQNNNGLISCPNCGNLAPREELLTGCPYCNTQFQIMDLSLRVAGYSQKLIVPSNADRLRGRLDVGYALYHEAEKKEYDQVLKKRMEQIDPLFSPTAFYNSMRNKLYSIVFAENAASLQNLADEDFNVAPFYEQFKDIIDIDIQDIETKNFKKSDSYILVDVVMNTMVLRYQQTFENAVWSRENITMSFVKHINNKTKNIFEPSIIQCQGCGSALSLYSGKACIYCGRKIDYLMYDWLLIDLLSERINTNY